MLSQQADESPGAATDQSATENVSHAMFASFQSEYPVLLGCSQRRIKRGRGETISLSLQLMKLFMCLHSEA